MTCENVDLEEGKDLPKLSQRAVVQGCHQPASDGLMSPTPTPPHLPPFPHGMLCLQALWL